MKRASAGVDHYHRDIVGAFRRLQDAGFLEIDGERTHGFRRFSSTQHGGACAAESRRRVLPARFRPRCARLLAA